MTKLKPCPFCGSEADYDWGALTDVGSTSYQSGWVTCENENCGATIDVTSINDSLSSRDLIEKWNNRVK